MIKKTMSLVLVMALVFSTVSLSFVSVDAADDTMTKLVSLIKQFPHGRYWNHMGSTKNNPEKVTDKPCSSHSNCDYYGGCSCNSYGSAIQCMGYANLISYKITGVDRNEYEESKSLKVSELRVGDIIRFSGHSVVVTGVKGEKISITDCNYGSRCIIRWTVVDADWFTGVQYVLHLKGNTRKNTNINFHDAYKSEDGPLDPVVPDNADEEDTDCETWKMEDSDSLNIRKKASTNADIVGSIPAGERFRVYGKSYDGEYLWAKVSYGDSTGYSVLNYSTYVSGKYEVPKFTKTQSSYKTADGISLTWKKVSGANRYKVYLYNSKKDLIDTFTSKTNSYTIKGKSAGTYYVRVGATNTVAFSWIVKGEEIKLKLVSSEIKPKKISINKTLTLEAGKNSTLKVTFEPSNTTERGLTWKSTDTKVASVDSNGVVKAVAPGKAVIKCTSKVNTKLTSSCTVTVKPSKVTLKQIKSGSGSSSIALKWSKSTGATGYIVYRYNSKTGKNDQIAKVTKTTYTDKNRKSSSQYTYIVKPYAKTGSGTFYGATSKIKAATTPARVTGLVQIGSDTGRLKLQWKKISSADLYVIYKYNSKKKTFVKLGTSKTNSYIVKTTPAAAATYRVVAVAEVSDGYLFGKASESLKGIAGLSAPKLKATTEKTTAKLSWNKVGFATEYNIYRLVDGKKKLIKTVSANTTSYKDTGLKSGKSYTYYIRATRRHSKTLNVYSDVVSIKVKTK